MNRFQSLSFSCTCLSVVDTGAKTTMDILSKVIPFRKKQNSFSRSRAKSHDDVYRKSRFNSLLSRSTSKLVTRSNSKLVSNSTDRLPTTGGSTIGNDDKWPFKRQTKKPIAYGNRADRLEYLGSRLCNYGLSDLHDSYDLHPSYQRNRTPVRSNGYLNDDGLRSHGDKVSPHSSGGLIEEGKDRRRSVISPPSANLGRYRTASVWNETSQRYIPSTVQNVYNHQQISLVSQVIHKSTFQHDYGSSFLWVSHSY